MPGPARFLDAPHRPHAHRDAAEMLHPHFQHPAQRIEHRATVRQADHGIVARLALPVDRCIGLVQHVEVRLAERALRFDDEAPDAAVTVAGGVHLHGLQVGEQRVPFLEGGFLLAEEQLRRSQLQRLVTAVKNVAQDHVHHLLDEKRRRIDRALEKAHVAALHGARLQQAVAEFQHQAVVVARIGILHGVELALRHAPSRLGHQRGVQLALGLVRLLDRMHLRPQVIGAQKIVRDAQASGGVAF